MESQLHLLLMMYMPWLNTCIATLGPYMNNRSKVSWQLVLETKDCSNDYRWMVLISLWEKLRHVFGSWKWFTCNNFFRGEDTRQFRIDAVKTSRRPGNSTSKTGRGSGLSKKTMCSRCGKSADHDIWSMSSKRRNLQNMWKERAFPVGV